MKNKLLLSSIRKIKSSYKRFLSLMFLSLLGVGFYVGIKASAPNMVITLDNYLDAQNMHDIEVIGTLGLTYEDILEIEKLGYKYFGFNLYAETYQVRWEYRLKLDEDYETKKAKFSKSTRKNIDACYKKGLKVRKGNIEDLDSMTEIFDATSQRKDFDSRSLDYYKKMYKHMKDLMTIYIAYLDPDTYLKDTQALLDNELEKIIEIQCFTFLFVFSK